MFFLFTIKRDISRRGGLLHCNMVQAASWSHGVGVIKGEMEAKSPIFMCIRMIDLFCCESWVGFYFPDSSTSMGLHVCFGYRRVVFAFISMFVYFGFASTCRLITFLGFFRFLFSFSLFDCKPVLTAFYQEGLVRHKHYMNWPSTVHHLFPFLCAG